VLQEPIVGIGQIVGHDVVAGIVFWPFECCAVVFRFGAV